MIPSICARLSLHPPRGVAARPLRRGGGTPAVHPGRAPRCARVKLRLAPARGPRRSAQRPRWDGEGAEWPGGDQGGAVSGAAGDAVDPRGLDGLGAAHRGQDSGEPPGQHRLARPGRAEEEHMMVTTPAWPLRLPPYSRAVVAHAVALAVFCSEYQWAQLPPPATS
jgi:hypothetical protein